MTLMPQRWMTFFTMPVGRVAVVALLLALASGETAYGQDLQRESLRGIGAVWVVIETLGEDATGIGFSEAGLKASVELQLRRNGVPLTELATAPFLYVNTLVIRSNPAIFSTVSVKLNQPVTVDANRQSRTLTTWDNAFLSVRSSADLTRDWIRDRISESVDVFSNDYLTVNPQP